MILLDGKKLADNILSDLKTKVDPNNPPHLDIIIVGDDPASLKYVNLKSIASQHIGINPIIHHLAPSSSQSQVINLINSLNQSTTSGIMIQLPLPPHLDKNLLLNTIDPSKDVDGLTSTNLGLLLQKDKSAIVPATALAIFKLLKFFNINLTAKKVVIINRSPLIGLPLSILLTYANATVTICHSQTKKIIDITKKADILISAIGHPNFIQANMIKANAVVVGAGFSINQSTGKTEGDLDFENIKDKCSFITPNFGGVGPVTIACLLKNLITVYLKSDLSKNPTL